MDRLVADICRWFDLYVEAFLGHGPYVEANIRCKQVHCHRAALMVRLGRQLGLEVGLIPVARLAGLLHDVGRFEQFASYRTFMDAHSINHGRLGVEVLRRYGVLSRLDRHASHTILTAVRYHNWPPDTHRPIRTGLPYHPYGQGL
ncbi:MAG: HD domain-containing protein [Sedimentisphaerales bacterium]|jgi:putative nucleotidyltransferase with HDIG domain|nr:HD domain-containing protein [Sedimentisphaerales bacterium]